MPTNSRGQVRRSQLITTYGVGSIIAVEDESFMVVGLDRWPVTGPDLHEPRLQRHLGVAGFAAPPANEDEQDIPVVRFPEVVWCPECRKLGKHRFFTSPNDNRCRDCKVSLVPSRFVIACGKGHIDDFPYFEWVHKGKPFKKEAKHQLTILAGGNTASLRSIRINCNCGYEETMEFAFQKTALNGVTRCKGRRPWLMNDDPAPCDETPRALQRGASNVWFANVSSAISIPPWSEGTHKLLERFWRVLQHIPVEALEATIRGMGVTADTPYTVADLVAAVRQRREGVDDPGQWSKESIRRQEFEALTRGRPEVSKDQDFVCEPTSAIPQFVSSWFDQVMLVKRLREIRVLESFARLTPPTPAQAGPFSPLSDERPSWLPAIEVIGEGVFLRLDAARIKTWEERADVRERAERINRNYRRRLEALNQVPDRIIGPRFVLIHTLAHALINEWSLDSGYPAAALRERLYVSAEMAGLLIYTASSDSAGSLGGVIAQAEPGKLEVTLAGALRRAAWCSADPVCVESEATGVDALNLAACHACSLLPEVSCEERNVFLDRGLLIGTQVAHEVGYFGSLSRWP